MIEKIELPSHPKTPDALETSSFILLSPPKMLRGRKEKGSVPVGRNEYWTDDREATMGTEIRYPRKSEVPSFPIMGIVAVPQEQSMEVDTCHVMKRNSSRHCSKRRSCSFDDALPIPKIQLRPRYYRDREMSQISQNLSSTIDAPKKNSISRKRSHHFRSHTFDGTDMIDVFSDPATRVASPPPDTPSFAMSYLNEALPSCAQFSPLGSCSMDSPRFIQSFARPIPRHSTPKGAPSKNLNSTSVSSATTAYGGGVGTICSSNTSAFETASSTFAKSRASSVRTPSSCGASATAGSLESFPEGNLFNDKWRNNVFPTTSSHQSFNSKKSRKNSDFFPFEGGDGIDGGTLPFNEVRVMGKGEIKFQTYEQLLQDGQLDSPRSSDSDPFIENLSSFSHEAPTQSLPFLTCNDKTSYMIVTERSSPAQGIIPRSPPSSHFQSRER